MSLPNLPGIPSVVPTVPSVPTLPNLPTPPSVPTPPELPQEPALPPVPGLLSADFSFDDGFPAAELCGFTVPFISAELGFNLPPLTFPPAIPILGLSLGLNCDLNNPINVSGTLIFRGPPGGGRVPAYDPDPDLAFDQ